MGSSLKQRPMRSVINNVRVIEKMHFASRSFCVFHPNSVEWGEYGVFIVASQKQRPKVLTLAEYVCGRKTHFASRLFCIFYASLREWGEYQVSRGIYFKKKGIPHAILRSVINNIGCGSKMHFASRFSCTFYANL